jgi:hypothetical protein
MRPKGKLFALVVLFAAVGLLTATGAFTTVEADRTADVNVAGDSSALLQIEPANNSEFADVNGNTGEVQIQLNSSNLEGGDGVNSNATTVDDNVLNITNNGANDVYVEIQSPAANGAEIAFYNATAGSGVENSGSNDVKSVFSNTPEYDDVNYDNRYILNSSNARVRLNSGSQVMVGIYIETYGLTNSTSDIFSDDITITAESVDS